MKTKFLFASLIASAVMVGCSNEELPVAQDASNDKLALIFDGIEGVESRMTYNGTYGSFLWAINDEIGVSRTSGKSVTTNYVFKAKAVTDDNTKDLLTGWDWTTGPNKYAYFETEFGSIFKGNYVVYYPYDKDFCEDGKITAKLDLGQVQDAAYPTDHVAKNGFMMSAPVAFEGGQSAEKFVLYPVFGRLAIKVKSAVPGCEVQTIVVRSLNGATLPTAMEIDADVNVVNGLLNPAAMHVVESSKVEEIVLAVDGTAPVSGGYTTYLTLIPGNYTNIAIDVVTNKGTYTKTFANAPVATGTKTDLTLEFGERDLQNIRTYYVASEASWVSTIEKIAGMTLSETSPATIKVVNDVEMNGSNFRSGNVPVMVPLTVTGKGSLKMKGYVAQNSNSLGAVVFNIPVSTDDTFVSSENENITFAKGLKAAGLTLTNAGSKYVVEGGEIGVTTIDKVNVDLTANNVVFKKNVTVTLTGDIDSNTSTTDVNFNNCTFKTGLTNVEGDITVNNASIVRPNANAAYSQLNVTGGNVFVKGNVTVDDADASGVLNIETGANVEFSHALAPITGTIKVKKDATLTLGSNIDYVLNGNIAVDGKLVNNGTLTALKAGVIEDVDDNNAHIGKLINNNIVRVKPLAYEENAWYTNQNIQFENNAYYNLILTASDADMSQANFKKYVAKSDVTGIELCNESGAIKDITLQGKGNNAYTLDFSDKNLILFAHNGDITTSIENGLKFKNIEVKGANVVTFTGASKNATVTTGDLKVNGQLTMTTGDNAAKANVTNVAIGTTGVLDGGAQVTYTGTFTNKGTVKGGNPVK